MSRKEVDRSRRSAASSNAKLDNAAGDVELTPADLEAVAGGIDGGTESCTLDDCPGLTRNVQSTCSPS